MPYHYSGSSDATCARAVGLAMPVSLKTSVEVCRAIKGKTVAKAKVYLENVAKVKQAVPMTRYFQEVAHKRGMAVGKYPVNVAKNILQIVESAESNARNKGLDMPSLYLSHAVAQRAYTSHHYGRLGRKGKRTHIEIIVKESKKTETKAKKAKASPESAGAKKAKVSQ